MLRKIALLLIGLLSFYYTFGQEISRIEPPNWWTGMKDSSLQIMLYGKDIGHLEPVLNATDVRRTKTTGVKNANYLFIDLIISRECQPGKFQIQLKDGIKTALSFDYYLFERMNGSAGRTGFNTSDVIYLITPDRFANGDTTNDNLQGLQDKANKKESLGRHGGDITGILKHLDYISDMGFTSIWLNPVLENKMPRHSYHGYAITDFYKVDPRFGSNEEYKNFCTEASKHNIKVIMDMVVNHCGLSHWWMNDLPTDDWINYQDQSFQQTNHRKTISTDPYAAKEDAKVLFEGWFVKTMPDLNVTNPLLGKYLIQNSIWWIEYAGLSGIRMDTYPYPDEDYMSEWSRRMIEEYPRFNIAGEIWYEDPAILSYWQKEKVNANGYVSWLPSLFDFPMQSALSRSLMSTSTWEDSWMFLYETLAKDFQYADPMNMVVFSDNHDMSRIYTQLDEDYTKTKMALAYSLTTRGIPQIYYGTEILMSNKGTDNHGVIRSDFPGGWEHDSVNAFNGTGLSEEQQNAQSFLKKLLTWRKNSTVIHHGKTIHFVPEKNVYVFFRYNDDETVMVILNKNNESIELNLDRFKSILQGPCIGKDIISDVEIPLGSKLQINSPGPWIIEINRK